MALLDYREGQGQGLAQDMRQLGSTPSQQAEAFTRTQEADDMLCPCKLPLQRQQQVPEDSLHPHEVRPQQQEQDSRDLIRIIGGIEQLDHTGTTFGPIGSGALGVRITGTAIKEDAPTDSE